MSETPQALIVATADAIVEAINEHEWGIEFSAERSYADWTDELTDTETLHVDVVPVQNGHARSELASRGSVKHRLVFDVCVRKKFTAEQQNEDNRIDRSYVDSLVLLTESLYHFFAAMRLENYDNAVWQEAAIVLTYGRKALREWRQYLGIVRLTFDARKQI